MFIDGIISAAFICPLFTFSSSSFFFFILFLMFAFHFHHRHQSIQSQLRFVWSIAKNVEFYREKCFCCLVLHCFSFFPSVFGSSKNVSFTSVFGLYFFFMIIGLVSSISLGWKLFSVCCYFVVVIVVLAFCFLLHTIFVLVWPLYGL